MKYTIKSSLKRKLFKGCFLLLFVFFSSGLQAQISVDIQKQPLKEVLKRIEAASSYRFFYNESLKGLDNIVSLKVQNAGIEHTMTQLLADTNISYRLEGDNLVTLFVKATSEKPDEKRRRQGRNDTIPGL